MHVKSKDKLPAGEWSRITLNIQKEQDKRNPDRAFFSGEILINGKSQGKSGAQGSATTFGYSLFNLGYKPSGWAYGENMKRIVGKDEYESFAGAMDELTILRHPATPEEMSKGLK